MMQFELWALYAFALVLPQFEAPKNLLWIVFTAAWLFNRWKIRDFGGPWRKWDSLILLWIVSGYLAALFAGLHNSEWLSAFDVLRYGSVLWCLMRSGYDEKSLGRLFAALVAGTLLGLGRGYYEVRVTGEHHFLGLNSVGHVNHSAIYVAIAFGSMLAWTRATWAGATAGRRMFGVLACAIFGLSLIVMQSRATVGVGFLVGFMLLVVYAARVGRSVFPALLGAVVLAAALFAAQPEVIRKNTERLQEHLFLAHRDAIWRAGFIAWRQYPVFGVGMGNYGRIDFARLEDWSRAQNKPFDRTRVLPQSHAHNLFINTLAERGLVGLAALLAVLATWAWSLVRNMPGPRASPLHWTYWGGTASAWLVAVLVGTVNTTLHHEHALISMLLLGGWLSMCRRPSTQPAPGAR